VVRQGDPLQQREVGVHVEPLRLETGGDAPRHRSRAPRNELPGRRVSSFEVQGRLCLYLCLSYDASAMRAAGARHYGRATGW
jgi:hypothetical protein